MITGDQRSFSEPLLNSAVYSGFIFIGDRHARGFIIGRQVNQDSLVNYVNETQIMSFKTLQTYYFIRLVSRWGF